MTQRRTPPRPPTKPANPSAIQLLRKKHSPPPRGYLKTSVISARGRADIRRARITQLFLDRCSMRTIVIKLRDPAPDVGWPGQDNVSLKTVCADIQLLKASWQATATDNYAEIRRRELAELDQMEAATANEFNKEKTADWVRTRLAIKQRRATMIGLDPKPGIDATADGGKLMMSIVDLILSDSTLGAIDDDIPTLAAVSESVALIGIDGAIEQSALIGTESPLPPSPAADQVIDIEPTTTEIAS